MRLTINESSLIDHPVKENDLQYYQYIKDHINDVGIIWNQVGKQNFLKLDDAYWYTINRQIEIHDQSKYCVDEFQGYRAKFYPAKKEVSTENTEAEIGFSTAWNHHQKYNQHHWEHWIMAPHAQTESPVILDMPYIFIVEMLCDWSAMSLKFKDPPTEFYERTKHNMVLSPVTKKCIERLIGGFDNVVQELK